MVWILLKKCNFIWWLDLSWSQKFLLLAPFAFIGSHIIIEIILMRYLQFKISSSNGTSVKGIRIKSKFKRLGLASIKINTSITYIRYQNRKINDRHHSIANISNLLYKFRVFFSITFHTLNWLIWFMVILNVVFFSLFFAHSTLSYYQYQILGVNFN